MESPLPKTKISSATDSTFGRPCKTSFNLFVNISGAGDMPKGTLVHRYLPNGVQNVVNRLYYLRQETVAKSLSSRQKY